jgi:hypothetical protein
VKGTRVLGEAVLAEFREGDSVLLDVARKRYHRLNPTAVTIWKGLEQGADDPALVARMTQEFDVSEGDAQAALAGFLAELEALGLLGPGSLQ